MKLLIRNRVKCRRCGDVIESKSRHDFRWCSCGAVAVDGGLEYIRRVGEMEDIEEMAEYIDLATATSEELQAILYADARNLGQEPNMEFLTPILEELTRRRWEEHPECTTPEEAFEEFNRHYRPEEAVSDAESSDEEDWSEYDADCEKCPHIQKCFPGWYPGATWDDTTERFI